MDKPLQDKKKLSVIAVYVIVMLVYSVLFFAIPFPKTATCIIACVFSWVAAAVSYMAVQIAFQSEDTLQSKVYGFPVLRIGYWYLLAQFILSAVFYLLACFVRVPAWVAVVVFVLLLGAALLGMIAVDSARDAIEEIQEQEMRQTKAITYFRLDVSDYVDRCKYPTAKTKLHKLAEKFRYSDPVSSEVLTEIEEQLKQEVERLGEMLQDKEELLVEQIERVDGLIEDRNRRCKAFKS